MSPEEVVDLLSTAAAFDRRTVGDADVIAWHAAVGDLDLTDAQAAVVQHYQATREWVMPSDVRKLVKQAREKRLAREVIPAPRPELADEPRAYQDQFKRQIKAMASGWTMPRALPAPKSEPTAAYNEARGGDRDPIRVAAILVACPWEPCRAAAGRPCLDAQGRPIRSQPAHEARLRRAGLVDASGNLVPREES